MTRWLSRLELAVLFFGIVVSIAAAFVFTDPVAVLLTLVLTLQAELILRVTSVLSAWTKWEPVLSVIRQGPRAWTDSTTHLINSMSTLDRSKGDKQAFLPAAQEQIRNAAEFVDQCAHGTLLAGRSDIELLFRFARTADSTIQAVTSYRDIPWWKSDRGLEFLAIQKDLLHSKHDFTIRRIMLTNGLTPDSAETDAMRRLSIEPPRMTISWVAAQEAAQIDCDVNLTIIDDRFCHQDINIGLPRPQMHKYSVDPGEIERARRKYNELLLHTTAFTP